MLLSLPTRIVWLLGCCGALACSQTVEQQLEGKWRGSELETVGGEITAEQAGWARGTELNFYGSRLDIRVPGQRLQRGSYSIDRAKEGNLDLTILGDNGHEQNTHLTLETTHMLRWHINQQNTVVLHRP